ncbi:1,2-phenylacetyl-CoA epoxidase subunit PaaD [Chitinasiproducens palmae]|uniref:Ring-1,2-phenylacetyl-CoA epoxidase subunit PaaD n=1 Tax=Chitinasiproducens palmae TaxID=1770053 RepID=A0A1H2PPT9_9BURK|nr:1,2-phenylacetyl-CoA epoxidase subunit PaaD [Chitinasiproducens palmae]SDV48344.1 ring-1,2-phenylacetyl-CoA epoxidase subunit PaaD [Chitinasiproducens palmae]
MTTSMPAVLERARAALDAVPDPEIPVVSIAELGILRDVTLADDGVVEVVITPTYSGCPAMSQIAEDIDAALDAAQIQPHRIRTVLSPAWSTDWIDEAARAKLRAYGIAPPSGACAARETPIHLTRRTVETVPCPRCGSTHTAVLAQFGSTACKALYRCLDCKEPFDYFKPY